MKSIKINSANQRIVAILFVLILAITSSKSEAGNPVMEKKHRSVVLIKTAPPKMDIYTAALFGDLKAIHQNIKDGVDLDTKDAYGSTALIIAATFDKTDVAKALIVAGADVNITNNEGGTALHVAAFLCREEIVEVLLNNGADKSLKNNYGSTALESISMPFENVKPIYEQFNKDLGPLGLKLDYDQIEETRPIIAEMLK